MNKQKDYAILTIENNFINDGYNNLLKQFQKGHIIEVISINSLNLNELDKLKKYKIVIIDDYIMNLEFLEPSKSNTLAQKWNGMAIYGPIREFVLNLQTTKILFLAHHDLHEYEILNKDLRDRSYIIFEHLIWYYEHQRIGINDVPNKYRDPWMSSFQDPMEHQKRIKEKYHSRIDLPFGFKSYNNIVKKKYDVIVPGINYKTRILAAHSTKKYKNFLKKSFYREKDQLLLILKTLSSLFPTTIARKLNQKIDILRKVNYRKELSESRICWIDGSAYKYPVYKFFEAIECNALIITNGITGIDDYGFKAGIHYVECDPEDFGIKSVQLLKDEPSIINHIVKQARTLAEDIHSIETRAQQLYDCLQSISLKKFKNGCFTDGRYEITEL